MDSDEELFAENFSRNVDIGDNYLFSVPVDPDDFVIEIHKEKLKSIVSDSDTTSDEDLII